MNKFSKLFAITIISLGLTTASVQATTNSASAWKLSFKKTVKHACNVAGFFNKNFGITVGYSGETHYTTDGGKTWPKGNNTSFCRFGLYILNEKTAWSCGNAGHIRKTVDGGKNWTAGADFGPSEPNNSKSMSFINANTGWVSSAFELGETNNGGKSWTKVNLPKKVGTLSSSFLRDKNNGYLLNAAGTLFVTKDHGKTWAPKSLGLKNEKILSFSGPTSVINFSDDKKGIVVYENEEGKITCVTTKDGGATWSKSSVPSHDISYLYLTPDAKSLTLTTDMVSYTEIQVLQFSGK